MKSVLTSSVTKDVWGCVGENAEKPGPRWLLLWRQNLRRCLIDIGTYVLYYLPAPVAPDFHPRRHQEALKVACVLITHLRAKAEMQRHPHLKDQPVLIADRSKSKPVVADYLPAATAVTAGMPLEQALSYQAGAVVLEADEPHYRRVFRQILSALQGVGDRVEDAGLGVAYVALDGLETLYGGEERLVIALLNAVPQNLAPRAGIGDGKFPAMVAARSSDPLRASKAPPDAAAFLSPRPIALLPVSEDIISALHRFGLHTLGQLAAMDQALLVDQFGQEGRWIWNLANGLDERPLVPLEYQETVTEQTSLPFSSTSLEMLLVASDTLLRRAYARPVMRGRYAGQAILECPVFSSAPWEKTVNFQESVGRWERASFIVRSRLEAEPPEIPVDGLSLTLSHFTGESGAQLGLLPDVQENRRGQLMEAERRLQTRSVTFSNGVPVKRPALYWVVEVAPWHPAPEMRAVQTPLDPLGGGLRPLLPPEPVAVKEDENGLPQAIKQPGNGAKRSGRTMSEADAGEWKQVIRIEDSWTFDLWWLPKPLSRTYYRVERESGGQVTLFWDQHEDCWYQQGH